jgi:hypothetical protein
MKALFKNIIFCMLILSMTVNCLGGSSSSDGGGEGGEEPCATVEECGGDPDVVAEGKSLMETQDFSDAETTYCDAYDDGDTGYTIAFGCFLAKLMLLPETSDAEAILTSLGEDAVDVESDIIEDVFENFAVTDGDYGFDNFTYTDYENLPLVSILGTSDGFTSKLAQIVQRLVDSGTSASDLQDQIFELVEHFEEMEDLLDDVLADSDFEYTIPADTFSTDDDLEVSYNDARIFMASVKSSIVSLSVFAAYDYGVDVENILNADGDEFDYEDLVDELNGGSFLTLIDGDLITDNRERFIDALDYLATAIENIDDGDDTVFEESLEDLSSSAYEGIVEFLEELKDSADSSGMVELSGIDRRSIKVDLYEFFSNPPEGTDVTSSDPFDYNSDEDTIEIVEVFFDDLLTDIASF